MNRRHDHTTAVCIPLWSSGGLRVVQLPAGSWHRLPHWDVSSVSQVWTKPLMSSTGKAHLIKQSHQENFMVNGVKCSTEVQENEKYQVTTICTAQDIIKDLKYGSLTTVSWAVCWLKLIKEVMLVRLETNCPATTYCKSLKTYGRFK